MFFFTENKESREVQQKTIFQLESDKFRLEEELQQTKDELQQTKDELQQTKEDNERLNERLTHVADTPTTLLPSTSTTTPNGECDVNTTTASSQNKSLNSKILLRIICLIKLKYIITELYSQREPSFPLNRIICIL